SGATARWWRLHAARPSPTPMPRRSPGSPGSTIARRSQDAKFLEKLALSPYTRKVAPRPAVFLDRDGTLTEEVGYVNHPSRLRLQARSAEAVRPLHQARIAVVGRAEQAGV